ncbi:hypothetical protein [Brevibacillus laterosporus]|uniref:Uncharacterized protein n=1 Tax=Brevibacillus laterosporus TaxID=1465 RepID=A0AAP3GAM1_BRELA|nr:hypothetical protein [Brevibacillus laterosporus]MCR8982635.1 hypothetical protein [Brevibacillus laterosporus]MCZ0809791.1 hypothetical protein [Brevibacillus laterosporus]MCZ0828375.1 hypothetical protein [Brevibacillus laterosporus]MCZ0852385.1 hypothetical protein [Brevibacillus laterosporus]
MQKSFYYLVPCSRSARLIRKFRRHGIPFDVEAIRNSDNFRFVFPDLPVRQYHVVHLVFSEVGEADSLSGE